MMSNPTALMRVLITYAICVPMAIVLGYILTDVGNNPTYSNLFVVGLLLTCILLPIFIKLHYPIMIFGLNSPMIIFFLKGSPPIWEVLVIMSLGIAIVERAVNSKKRFLSAPSIVWPLLFTIALVVITAKLTGGIGLHTMGSEVGGGKKYIVLFLGVATFFALISRRIPEGHRKLYIGLYLLSGLPAFISDLAPVLPYGLHFINYVIPPTAVQPGQEWEIGITRLGYFASSAGAAASFMLAVYGLRGIFAGGKAWWRVPVFVLFLGLTLLGGFRNVIASFGLVCFLMFFMEGLHRTRLLPLFLLVGLTGACLLVPLAPKLPYTFQRALSFLPLNVDPKARADAEDSSEWRFRMWHDLWPLVPQYLLLGKGYALTADDFQMLGNGDLANGAESRMDASEGSLAIAGDYHNGPLSTLIPFGIWGGITMAWFMLAGWRAMYRNYKYGDSRLKIVNIFMLAQFITHVLFYFFIFGGYSEDIFGFAKTLGFSIALNGGILGPKSQPVPTPSTSPQLRPWVRKQPQTQPI